MPLSLTTITGPVYLPNGNTPVNGRVSFELSSWDQEVGEALLITGPVYSEIDENGQFTVQLYTTTAGTQSVHYRMFVLWEDSNLTQSYVNNTYVIAPTPHYTKKYIGTFALSGSGPFQVSDLNIISETNNSSFDAYLEMRAYADRIDLGELDDAVASTVVNAALTVADRVQTGLNVLATDADRKAAEDAATASAESAAIATAAALAIPKNIPDAASFEASTLTYADVTAGDVIFSAAEKFTWRVVATGAAVWDRINGNGVKVLALPLDDGSYAVEVVTPWTVPNTAQNNVIAHANRNGVAYRGVSSKPLTYVYTKQEYDLRAGPRTALVVSNVMFESRVSSIIRLRDVPFVLGGNPAQAIENLMVKGFSPDANDVSIRKKGKVVFVGNANPATVSVIGHGYATGDKIRLFDIGGMPMLNDTTHTITLISADQFTLDGVDSSGFPAFASEGTVRPETDATPVKMVHGSRIFIDDITPTRLPHILKIDAPAGAGVSDVFINGGLIRGHESYPYVAINTRLAAYGAGLYVHGIEGYPSNIDELAPATLIPKLITGATQANPVSITCVAHGYATGTRMRMCQIGGMTQISGQDFTITSTGADTFTLGVDGTGYSAYTSGGWAARLHTSYQYDTGFVSINGKWDTARIDNCIVQHWAWLWDLRTSGPQSFIWDRETTFDYGGAGRYRITVDGHSVSKIEGSGWHFALNSDFISLQKANPASAGFVDEIKISDMTIGMVGGDVLRDEFPAIVTEAKFNNVSFGGVGRSRKAQNFMFIPGPTGSYDLSNIVFHEPTQNYGAGTDTFFVPNFGLYSDNAGGLEAARYSVVNCQLRGSTAAYLVPTNLNATSGVRGRTLANNRKGDGLLPEYVVTTTPAMPASGVVQTNVTGLVMEVSLSGGVMTSVNKNGVTVRTGAGPHYITVGRGETWSCAHTAAPTLTYMFND